MEKADVVVIGAGPGGYVAAIRCAQLGKKTVLVEEDKIGGICLNYGCIPSKAMIHAADFLNKVKNAAVMGINIQDASIDFPKMQAWKDSVLKKLTGGVEFLCKSNKITIVKGRASFLSESKLKIENNPEVSELEFDTAILATGSKPIEIPGFKFDGDKIIDSTSALSLQEIPQNLVVVGGGYIGLELRTVYAKLGSKVTVLEMTSQLLPGNDNDVVQVVQKKLESLGVEILLETKANGFENGKVNVETKEGSKDIDADKVLVTVGRIPNTKNLNLEAANIELGERGFVKVNENLQSSNSKIYAIGDISTGPMLAHKASHQGIKVAETISGEINPENSLVPAVIFTDPEIASVGISELEAQEKSLDVVVGKFPFTASGRAMTKMSTVGFVKMIANKQDQKILGVQMVGSDVSDLIGEASLAIRKGTTLKELADTIHPHPTMSETLMEAAEATMGRAIHILNPKK